MRNEIPGELVGVVYQLQLGYSQSSFYNAGTFGASGRRDHQRDFKSGSHQIGGGGDDREEHEMRRQ